MAILKRSLAAFGVFIAGSVVLAPNLFAQASTLTAFYTAPVASMAPMATGIFLAAPTTRSKSPASALARPKSNQCSLVTPR